MEAAMSEALELLYLERYGYSTDGPHEWHVLPIVDDGPKLRVHVIGHTEVEGNTMYTLECCLDSPRGLHLRWQSKHRLLELRQLHDVVKQDMGTGYAPTFAGTPFAQRGGLPGTTDRLSCWFDTLIATVNAGAVAPSVVMKVLRFLQTPGAPEPSQAECAKKAAAMKILVEARCDVSGMEKEGVSLANTAAEMGETRALELLLDARCDVEARSSNSANESIFMAAAHGRTAALMLLIASRCDVDAPGKMGATPAFVAAQKGHITALQQLIAAKCDINSSTDDGATPLYIAAGMGHTCIVQELIQVKGDVNAAMTVESCFSPLTAAAYMGHADVCRLLVQNGADASYEALPKHEQPSMCSGGTAAQIATQRGHSAIIRILKHAELDHAIKRTITH